MSFSSTGSLVRVSRHVAIVVVRRGYGVSGGEGDGRRGGCGGRGSFTDAGDASAEDLRAAAHAAAKLLPEVDARTNL